MQGVEAGWQARAARLTAMTPAARVALAVRFGEGGLAAYEDDSTGDRYGAVADRSGVVHAYEKG